MAASWEYPGLPMLSLPVKESGKASFLAIKPVSFIWLCRYRDIKRCRYTTLVTWSCRPHLYVHIVYSMANLVNVLVVMVTSS